MAWVRTENISLSPDSPHYRRDWPGLRECQHLQQHHQRRQEERQDPRHGHTGHQEHQQGGQRGEAGDGGHPRAAEDSEGPSGKITHSATLS